MKALISPETVYGQVQMEIRAARHPHYHRALIELEGRGEEHVGRNLQQLSRLQAALHLSIRLPF